MVSVLSRYLVGITRLQGWFGLAARIVSELSLYELKIGGSVERAPLALLPPAFHVLTCSPWRNSQSQT